MNLADKALCPEDREFLPLATGDEVPAEVRGRMESHLGTCSSCRERLERLRSDIRELRETAGGLTEEFVAGDSSFHVPATPGDKDTLGTDLSPRSLPTSIGRYRIVGALSAGGQGEVYRAVHPTLEKELVVKWSHRKARTELGLRAGLLAEGRVLAELEHPNLARVYDLDFHQDRPFLVLEFVRGRHLAQVAREEPLSPRQAAALVATIARALGAAHRKGVVHQDIKPNNIVIDEHGRPRVIDFGLARVRDAWVEERDRPGVISGTVEYMAPEQARGETERMGPRADIFSLGGVLYFLLVGHAPFPGEDWRECLERAKRCDFDRSALRAHGVPRHLERICLKAMASEPGDRYPRAEGLAAGLDAYVRRRSVVAGGVALACVVVLVGLVLSWWRPWAPEIPRVAGPAYRMDEPRIRVQVGRGEDTLRLADALPLRTGDELSIGAELPQGLKASIFWFDSEGKLSELSPAEASVSGSRITLTYPAGGKFVRLEGAPGTELALVCAGSSKPTIKDLEGALLLGKPWPELPRNSSMHLGREGARLGGPRGLGAVTERPAGVSGQADALCRKLSERFEWFVGLGFPHVD